MKKLFLLSAIFLASIFANAQTYILNNVEYNTQCLAIDALNFAGSTLSTAPSGKGNTVSLVKTTWSKPYEFDTSFGKEDLHMNNIIGHPTLGWDDTDFHVPESVPEIYAEDWTINDAYFRGDYILATYGRKPYTEKFSWGESELDISRRGRNPHLILLLDPSKDVKKAYNTYNYTFTDLSDKTESDRLSIGWAIIKDGILYMSLVGNFSKSHNGGQNAYIVAVDTKTDKTLWLSKPLTCNSANFVIVDNSIICGYGYSGEADYVYVLNRFTGVRTHSYLVPKAPSYFAIGEDGDLYVTLYDKHISYKINK